MSEFYDAAVEVREAIMELRATLHHDLGCLIDLLAVIADLPAIVSFAAQLTRTGLIVQSEAALDHVAEIAVRAGAALRRALTRDATRRGEESADGKSTR